MVDGQLERMISSKIIVSNLERNEDNKCQYCDNLKAELYKEKLDLLSYEEIIKILLEEQPNSQPKLMEAGDHLNKEGSFYPVSRGSSIKPSSRLRNNLIQLIPTANKFGVLANLNDVNETSSASTEGDITSKNFKKKNQKKAQRPNSSRTRRQRILLIGDSHVRNCASDLQHNLDGNYEVSSFVKPGATMEEIVNTVSEDIQTLSNKDVVIVWGGSNDISKNNSKVAINHLCKFVEEKHVNLVIMKAPQRHDLMT